MFADIPKTPVTSVTRKDTVNKGIREKDKQALTLETIQSKTTKFTFKRIICTIESCFKIMTVQSSSFLS